MENTAKLKCSIAWSDFKLNSDGMVPVIAQDYQTNEVLMLAYMNEEAFNTTLETGKMTYWSRSRNELWTKGLTSGHLQFVKSLTLDCDIFIFRNWTVTMIRSLQRWSRSAQPAIQAAEPAFLKH